MRTLRIGQELRCVKLCIFEDGDFDVVGDVVTVTLDNRRKLERKGEHYEFATK